MVNLDRLRFMSRRTEEQRREEAVSWMESTQSGQSCSDFKKIHTKYECFPQDTNFFFFFKLTSKTAQYLQVNIQLSHQSYQVTFVKW